MKPSTESSARRETRGEVCEKRQVEVFVRRNEDADRRPLKGRLEDVSCQGARAVFNGPLERDEAVEVQIVCNSLNLNVTVDADVRWVHYHCGGWKTGLQFQRAILDERLDQLAAAGVIDRRKSARQPVSAEAAFQWCGRPGHMNCQVLDLSSSGACLTSTSPGRTGERLLLKVADVSGETIQIPAVARWDVAYESGHLIGCEFLGDPGPVELPARARNARWAARARDYCFSNLTLLLICTFIAAGLPIWRSQIVAVRNFWSGTVERLEAHSTASQLRISPDYRLGEQPVPSEGPNASAADID